MLAICLGRSILIVSPSLIDVHAWQPLWTIQRNNCAVTRGMLILPGEYKETFIEEYTGIYYTLYIFMYALIAV